MIKALFFDVDGTLVSFKTHRIPQSAIAALQQAHDKGVKIFTATGRPLQLLDNIQEVRHVMDGYILATGALCLCDNHVVMEDLIPKDDVEAVLAFCVERDLPAVVVGKRDLQIVNRNARFEHVFRNMLNVGYDKFDVPIAEVVAQGVLQITPFFTEADERYILPKLKRCISSRWYPSFCDITSSSADKANGIAAMARYLGIDVNSFMAFGDGGNDMSMLRVAGVSVAMGNAADEVKANADYVTTSVDEDGVWNALHNFGII